jgi:hypothetical protein
MQAVCVLCRELRPVTDEELLKRTVQPCACGNGTYELLDEVAS